MATIAHTPLRRASIALAFGIAVAIAAALALPVASAAAAAPQPCGGATQITDVSGDGHHSGTDVLSAWFSETSGHLQAVVKVKSGIWVAEHDDEPINGAGYAFVFTAGGTQHFVRANAPVPGQGSPTFDFGTYANDTYFTSAGATTGEVVNGAGGTVTIDLPASLGLAAGTRLTKTFVLTYDGEAGDGTPDWVDHAPGGTTPTEATFGADYTVGSCNAVTPTVDPQTGQLVAQTVSTTGVTIVAPATISGSRTIVVRGKVLPTRAGRAVTLTRSVRGGKPVVQHAVTKSDGSWLLNVPIGQTTVVRAEADGVASQSLTVDVDSVVHVRVRHLANGLSVVTGTVSPALPGQVLWLRSDAISPTATRLIAAGQRSFRIVTGSPGAFQAVYVPFAARAERSVSNTVRLR